MYRRFYHLHCKPFENTPDPDFLFLSAQHQETLSALLYGIEEAKGFILITGSVGTGKTTLVRTFLQKTSSEHIIINIINPKISFADVYTELKRKLALHKEDTNQLEGIELLKERLIELNELGRRVVILVDEAHLLQENSLEEIRLLSNIEHEKEKLIQIVLIGQNEIYALLGREKQKSLQQRIVINRQLVPLSVVETAAYIEHRLQVAGVHKALFNKETVRLIWKKSQGAPRVINHICDNALLIGYATEAPSIHKGIIKEVIQDMSEKTALIQQFKWATLPGKTALALAAALTLLISAFLFDSNQTILLPTRPAPPLAFTTTDQQNVPVEEDKITPPKIVVAHSTSASKTQLNKTEKVKTSDILTPLAITTVDQQNSPVEEDKITPPKIVVAHSTPAGKTQLTKIGKVQTSDILTQIAFREYGTMSETVLDYIQRANNIKDINKIYSGQEIRLPQINTDDLICKKDDNRFHIHYASFYSNTSATLVTERLQGEGKNVQIEESIQGNNPIYRVYIGNFPDKEAAKTTIATLDFKYLRFLNSTTTIAFN